MSVGTVPIPTTRPATLDDLAKVDGKAELIDGRIVHQMPTGHLPNRVASRIFRSLDDHAEAAGQGVAYTDSIGFAVSKLLSGRESFSPDASFFIGPVPKNLMGFVRGAPTFAVEVCSEYDYGPAAEAALAAKRADYFLAGTLVVWDVDPIARSVRKYQGDPSREVVIFGPGSEADAEPAVPGWRIPIDRLFP